MLLGLLLATLVSAALAEALHDQLQKRSAAASFEGRG